MKLPKIVFLLLVLLVCGSPEFGHPDPPVDKVMALYHQADHLYRLVNNTPATDSAALAGFEDVIRRMPSLPDFKEKDTVYAFSWLKKGILLDASANYPRAIDAYRRMLDIHLKDDSLSFVAKVYAGAAYYNLNDFDSADYFLQKADGMAPEYRNWDAEIRLYNTLGVMYYDNGNYRQGINYFNQALRLVEGKKPLDKISAINLQTNIATSFYKLGLYQEALALYKKALIGHLSTNFIYINMGRTYTALEQYPQAMAAFRLVDKAKVPAVLNEMAYTQLQLHRPDSCAWFLDRLLGQEQAKAGSVNRLDIGINQLYRADLLTEQHRYKDAIASLQESINLLTVSSGYFRLFDALFKKAQVLALLYKDYPSESWLLASRKAYTAALSLLRYIEKSYDTDDAKLFLKKKSAGVYDGALAVCLRLHQLHPDSAYLGQAFMISEKSKATIIFANLQENAFANGLTGTDGHALKEMRNIKYNIARLNIQSEQSNSPETMQAMMQKRADYEIALAKLQKQLEQNSAYYKLKYDDDGPGLKEIQQRLSGDEALVSYYTAAGTLHTFVLTRESIAYHRNDSIAALQKDVESWVSMLKVTDNGRRFKAGLVGDRLYRELIKPIQEAAPSKKEWIVIPDGFLYYLPFESLPGGDGEDFLLRSLTISYRLSSRLLDVGAETTTGADVLSFAPFASRASADLPRLAASGDEIAALKGRQYIDSSATKSNFLKAANHYPVIHLATHAMSSLTNAAGSFISFYPASRRPDENNLYLEELYGLNLSATRLVIISACETGQGELAGKEGVISLSRAFAYAGCASTINSLWKADDKATAYILKRFYVYLQKGESKAKALRQAKLDYLSGDAINKSPAYWAHLVLMGDESALYASTGWWKWSVVMIVLGAVVGVAVGRRIKSGKKKVGDF
ncbi:MAG TPA: CHAT domain-containing tetratricopeptide repeat protein [Puia sp.]|jgi:CHAT domain-containing protein